MPCGLNTVIVITGVLSSLSKTKPVASVSGQASGCCITPTGYRQHRVVTNGVQPLNLSQVSKEPSAREIAFWILCWCWYLSSGQ